MSDTNDDEFRQASEYIVHAMSDPSSTTCIGLLLLHVHAYAHISSTPGAASLDRVNAERNGALFTTAINYFAAARSNERIQALINSPCICPEDQARDALHAHVRELGEETSPIES
jgi:hypothetical protein